MRMSSLVFPMKWTPLISGQSLAEALRGGVQLPADFIRRSSVFQPRRYCNLSADALSRLAHTLAKQSIRDADRRPQLI